MVLFLDKDVQAGNAPNQYNIKPGNVYNVSNDHSEELLTIFCWPGDPKTVFGLWKTATVSPTITQVLFDHSSTFTVYVLFSGVFNHRG